MRRSAHVIFVAAAAAMITIDSTAAALAAPDPKTHSSNTSEVAEAGAGTDQQEPAPVDRGAEIDQAIASILGAYSNTSGDGQMVGTGIGLLVGCPLGAVTGGTLTALTSAGVLTPLGAIGGCLLGGLTLGGLGGTVGGAVTGLPALAGAATQEYADLHSKGLISSRGRITAN